MAELEVARHGKKAIQVLGKTEHPMSHRLREMALEIFTIVFAVTLSIWLHGLSVHSHEQQQVRSFLLGLKNDLQVDINQLNQMVPAYRRFDANFNYLASLDPAQPPDPQKFDAAYQYADRNWFFRPNNSRFEGFKSGGKLTNIENERLLNKIMLLYQALYPDIDMSEGGWRTGQGRLRAYQESQLNEGGLSERYKLIVSPKGKRLLTRMVASPQLYERYGNYIALAKDIIKDIDQAYPDAH